MLIAMKRKVFVSGPIQGMEKEQSYSNVIRDICLRHGFEVVDPWEREKSFTAAQKMAGGTRFQRLTS